MHEHTQISRQSTIHIKNNNTFKKFFHCSNKLINQNKTCNNPKNKYLPQRELHHSHELCQGPSILFVQMQIYSSEKGTYPEIVLYPERPSYRTLTFKVSVDKIVFKNVPRNMSFSSRP